MTPTRFARQIVFSDLAGSLFPGYLGHDSVNIQVYFQIPSPPPPLLNMTSFLGEWGGGGQNEERESTWAREGKVQLSVCQLHAFYWRLKSEGWCLFKTPAPPLRKKKQLWREVTEDLNF